MAQYALSFFDSLRGKFLVKISIKDLFCVVIFEKDDLDGTQVRVTNVEHLLEGVYNELE